MRIKSPAKIKLAFDERVVAVVPTEVAGPAWGNSIVCVYISDNQSRFRSVRLQYDDLTPALKTLFCAGEAMTTSLIRAVPVRKDKPKEIPHA